MRFVATACVLLFLGNVAFAGDEPALTIAKCLEINGALVSLETPYDAVIKGTVVHLKYKLGDAWGPVGLNRTALLSIVKSAQDVNNKFVEEIAGEGKSVRRYIDPDKPDKGETDQWKDYTAKFQKFVDGPCPVTLARIKASDLKSTDDNPIPVSIVITLDPILDR